VDFADFGNSPTRFLQSDLKGKKLAYSTTNGTRAIELAKPGGSVAIASFSNLEAVVSYLLAQQRDVLILCSGWKNGFSREDSVCAGAIANWLIFSKQFRLNGDAAMAVVQLWMGCKDNVQPYCSLGDHYRRLEKLGQQVDLDFSFRLNTSSLVPVWDQARIVRYRET